MGSWSGGILGGKDFRELKMPLVVLMLFYWFCAASSAGAQTKSVTDLANYRGADREEMLKAGAKKEGKLVW